VQAADFFVGMVVGNHQLEALLGLPAQLTSDGVPRIAREAAARFVRAYAPVTAP
jgi:hypothetical protein